MLDIMAILASFLLGLLFGSFCNVVAIRTVRGESIIRPPSHCLHCRKELGARDLVPVLSYLLLRGRCRHCGQTVSPRYPAGEMACGLAYALMYVAVGFRPELVAAWFLVSVLAIITQTDLEEMIIPNRVVAVGVIGAVLLRLWSHPLPWWDYAIASVLGSGLLLLAGVIGQKMLGREAMGGGDIKLYVFIGLMLGMVNTALSVFFASVFGLVYGLIIRRIGKGQEMPFGPFIAAGAVCAYLWGDMLIRWYWSLL